MKDDSLEKLAFIHGALFTLIIVLVILVNCWFLFFNPWLHGVAYNMQLDESVLIHFGITPTSNYQAMWDQVARLPGLTR